MNVGTKP